MDDEPNKPYNRYNELSPQYCLCESAYCHPTHTCSRKPSRYVWCEYIVEICDTCAANMCISGGADYIHLIKEHSHA